MKNYIRLSRESFEDIIEECCNTSSSLINANRGLNRLKGYSGITEEENEILIKAFEILVEKTDKLESILENTDNEFYDIDNIEVDY